MFGNDDQVLIKNPLGRDIIFKFDGDGYTIGAGDIVPLPGYMASFALKRIVDAMLAENREKNLATNISEYGKDRKLAKYVEQVVFEVRETIRSDEARSAEDSTPVKLQAWKGDKEIGGDIAKAAKNAGKDSAPEVDLTDTAPIEEDEFDKKFPDTNKAGLRLEDENAEVEQPFAQAQGLSDLEKQSGQSS